MSPLTAWSAPRAPGRLGLGVGMDLPWGQAVGFDPAAEGPSAKVRAFLERHRGEFAYLVFSFQPRDAGLITAERYVPAYERLLGLLPAGLPVAFHQTTLNLGAVGAYDRKPAYEFTNQLASRFGFRWVVEDIGIWSLAGIPMPYPLPPYLTDDALEAVVANVADAAARLRCPLHIEFPGFTDGMAVVAGRMDAYTWFRHLAERADAHVTIDVGHVLSYRWLLGHRGRQLYDGLDRLPLAQCRELHLSGCTVHRDRFLDMHHGVLLDEQIELCELLLEGCPNLIAVTYEDPQYGPDGALIRKSLRNLERLRELVEQWIA
jgi:uncharacterized protein (UPF0276 family)